MISPQPVQTQSTSKNSNQSRRFERLAGFNYEVIVSKYEHAALAMKFHNWIRKHIKATGPIQITPITRGVVQTAAAPDLGLYIIGSTESFATMTARILRDLHNGAQLIWVVSPEEKAVIVYSRKGMRMLGLKDKLDGGDVLPGFSVPVSDIIGGEASTGSTIISNAEPQS